MAQIRGRFATALVGAVMALGCSGSGGITDDSEPVASASATPQSGAAPLDVAFTGSVTGGDAPLSFEWDFDDGAQSTSQFPNHTYATPGTYTASFTVTDVDGDFDSATVSVTVLDDAGDPLQATAVAAPMSGLAPLQVNFSGTAIGGTTPYAYSWEFGDGGTATTASPSHTYTAAGDYTAVLTVTDAASDTDTYSINIEVGDRDTMVAAVTATPTSGTAPLLVSMTCNASGGAPPYTYAWDFGDGGSSTTKNPSHQYTTAGTFTAACTTTDSLSANADAEVTITVGGANLPTVSATATPTSGQAPLIVAFYNTVTGGDAPYTYSWAFGDGTSATTANPSHTYTSGGTFTAVVTVSDTDGDSASDSVVIQVGADNFPSATVSATPVSGVAPLDVDFTAAVAGGDAPVTYSWAFGDGATVTGGLTKTHTYSAAGSYTATFTATDNDGDIAYDTVEISVGDNSQPVAFIIANTYSGDAPLVVDFEGWVFGGDTPLTYSWAFGDGGTSTLQDPTHTFTAEGVYTVSFVVQDSNGDSDADSVDILVTTGLPDLDITAFAIDEIVDGTVSYQVAIQNGGTTAVGAFWVDLFYDEADAPVVGADYGDAWQQVPSLAPGATVYLYFDRADTLPGSYQSWALVDTFNAIAESNETNNVDGPLAVTVTGDPVTETILTQSFEGSWTGDWLLYDDNSSSGEDYWGDSTEQAHAGTWAAFCAATGDAETGYDNDMDAYMEISLDFGGYTWIDFETWVWYDTEDGYDYLYIEVDDGTTVETLRTYTGDSSGWTYVYANLDDYAGLDGVWLTFHFHSDSSWAGDHGFAGAYLDDLLVEGTYFP